jgi:hypothetical protein
MADSRAWALSVIVGSASPASAGERERVKEVLRMRTARVSALGAEADESLSFNGGRD